MYPLVINCTQVVSSTSREGVNFRAAFGIDDLCGMDWILNTEDRAETVTMGMADGELPAGSEVLERLQSRWKSIQKTRIHATRGRLGKHLFIKMASLGLSSRLRAACNYHEILTAPCVYG